MGWVWGYSDNETSLFQGQNVTQDIHGCHNIHSHTPQGIGVYVWLGDMGVLGVECVHNGGRGVWLYNEHRVWV